MEADARVYSLYHRQGGSRLWTMHLNDCASFRREKCLSFIKHQETVTCEMKNQSCWAEKMVPS